MNIRPPKIKYTYVGMRVYVYVMMYVSIKVSVYGDGYAQFEILNSTLEEMMVCA